MFERAAKRKLRFASSKGSLSVEDLYDLSLTSLDSIAKNVNRQLKAEAEESFIEKKSVTSSDLELQLQLLKHIIADKMAVVESNKRRSETMAKKAQIDEILMRKKSQELESMSVEDLTKLQEQMSYKIQLNGGEPKGEDKD